jgi:hypothetical protein
MTVRNTVKRSAPAMQRPGLEFYAEFFPRYNRILAEQSPLGSGDDHIDDPASAA